MNDDFLHQMKHLNWWCVIHNEINNYCLSQDIWNELSNRDGVSGEYFYATHLISTCWRNEKETFSVLPLFYMGNTEIWYVLDLYQNKGLTSSEVVGDFRRHALKRRLYNESLHWQFNSDEGDLIRW